MGDVDGNIIFSTFGDLSETDNFYIFRSSQSQYVGVVSTMRDLNGLMES